MHRMYNFKKAVIYAGARKCFRFFYIYFIDYRCYSVIVDIEQMERIWFVLRAGNQYP